MRLSVFPHIWPRPSFSWGDVSVHISRRQCHLPLSPAHASSHACPSMARREVRSSAGHSSQWSPPTVGALSNTEPSSQWERAKHLNQENLVSQATVSSLKMQSNAREASKLNHSNASISTMGFIPHVKRCFDTQEIVRWMEDAREPPCARWGFSCRFNCAILAMHPGMFVNKDTEPRQHSVFVSAHRVPPEKCYWHHIAFSGPMKLQ